MMDSEPDYATPTGEYIEEWLDDHGMTQAAMAQRLGVSRKHLNRVIAGAPVTPPLAQSLELVTHVPARRWLQLEALYRADLERLGVEVRFASKTALIDRLPNLAAHLRREKYITATRRHPGRLLLEVMSFFQVADPDHLEDLLAEPAAAFRKTLAHTTDPPAVAGWLRLGELQIADDLATAPPFDRDTLASSVQQLRRLSTVTPDRMESEVTETLTKAGVTLAFVPPVKGCRAYGATRWLNGKPVIQLSLRGRNDGQLWFTLLHEVGHVLLHPNRDFLEDGSDGSEQIAEKEADHFARTALIPDEAAHRLSTLRSLADVEEFAAEMSISPGIVVGRLQRDRLWPQNKGNHLYVRYMFREEA